MCDAKIRSVLYEVSLYLAEQGLVDYEAKQLHAKVVAVMNDDEFSSGKEELTKTRTASIVKRVCS